MPKITVKIDSILGGVMPTRYVGGKDQFLSSLGVDPDWPIGSDTRGSGQIVPVAYSKISGSNVTGAPLWIDTNYKTALVYAYMSDGKFVSYNSSLGSETLIGTPTSGAGNGFKIYNNYAYLFTPTDVSRYGPLDGSASLTNTVWTGATLGSQTALTNTSYPSIRSVSLPNHAAHVHTDNKLYFCDFKNGQGYIHFIKTKKTTDEGDTNDVSTYNALDLPFGWLPVDLESFGNDLAILAIQTTNATLNQGRCVVFLWDTFSDSFYAQIPLADPLGTALLNVNGILHAFTGNVSNGWRMSRYIGGATFQDVRLYDEGAPPFAGAVDSLGGRIYFGGYVSDPASAACVFSYGSKNPAIPMGLHVPVRTTSGTTTPICTAIKVAEQASFIAPRVLAGWRDGAPAYGIDQYSASGTLASVFRTAPVNVGGQFKVVSISIPLGAAVAANMSWTPKVWVDDASASTALRVINNTNYANSERRIVYYPSVSGANIGGDTDFFLEFTAGSTSPLPIKLPILVEIETDMPYVQT